jgi:hypothetical protein
MARIVGSHSIIYSKDPEGDRVFLKDVLKFPNVDVGDGWLIFGLPPSEVAVHPSEKNDVHEFYLMCDDVEALVAELQGRGIECDPIHDLGWGVITQVLLPGGGKLGIYQPRHARPPGLGASGRARAAGKQPSRKPATKAAARHRPAARKRKH